MDPMNIEEDIKPEPSQFTPFKEGSQTCSPNLKQKRKNEITSRVDSNDSIYLSKAPDLKRARWSKVDSKDARKPADPEAVGLPQLEEHLKGSSDNKTQVRLVSALAIILNYPV
jgi:hypothetical protein